MGHPIRCVDTLLEKQNTGIKVDGFGFDPAHPTDDPERLNNQMNRGHNKVDGFGFDPAHPTADFGRLSVQRERGLKVNGFGFDPAHPSHTEPRGIKVGGFGFDPAHPTPQASIEAQAARGRKVDGFGFDPAHPTPNREDKGTKVSEFGFDPAHPTPPVQESKLITDIPKWEAPTFEESMPNPVHTGKNHMAPPGGEDHIVFG